MKKLIIWAVLIIGIGYGGAKLYLHHEVEKSVDQAVRMARVFADISYERVASTITGELTVEGIRVKMPQYRDELVIDSVGIDTPSFLSLLALSDIASSGGNKMPDRIAFLVDGVHVPIAADYFRDIYEFSVQARGVELVDLDVDEAAKCTGRYGFSPGTLSALGYTEQDFSMRVSLDNDDREFSFNILADVADMWAVDATVKLAGDMMTQMMGGGAARARLSDLEIVYTDMSLNSRVRKLCTEKGLSPDEVLAAQLETFKFYGESNGIVFDEFILDPYREFLEGKSTLKITAQPNSPVAMSQLSLYKPSDVPALLNLAASVE